EQPIWGVINLPALKRLYIGNNQTAWCNDRVVRMRETPDLKNCFLLTTDPKRPYIHHSRSGWDNLLASTDQFRSWGDCFGYTLIASQGAHIRCDPKMSLWDIAAPPPVVRGAGALATNWNGNNPVGTDSLVVAHPRHHAN